MKKALKLFSDSEDRVFLINELEKIREYLDGNSNRD